MEESDSGKQPLAVQGVAGLVDPKGIEPSNLTDANRSLSQVGLQSHPNSLAGE